MAESQKEKMIQSLKSSQMRDELELENEKLNFIKEIKKINKEELFPKPKKISLWKKIMKVLNF
jgi:hypothetical protein